MACSCFLVQAARGGMGRRVYIRKIYLDLRSQQDSNLRTRLRSGCSCMPPACGNVACSAVWAVYGPGLACRPRSAWSGLVEEGELVDELFGGGDDGGGVGDGVVGLASRGRVARGVGGLRVVPAPGAVGEGEERSAAVGAECDRGGRVWR